MMTGIDGGVSARTEGPVVGDGGLYRRLLGKKWGLCVGMGQKICVPHCLIPGGWVGLSNSLWYGCLSLDRFAGCECDPVFFSRVYR